MPPIYANDIGGVGQGIMADRQMRDQQSQAALGMLMTALARRQQQQNLEAEQARASTLDAQNQQYRQFQMRQSEQQQADTETRNKQNQDYNERAYREVVLPESRARVKQMEDKSAITDAKAVQNHLAEDLRFRVEQRLPYNPADYAALPDDVKKPLLDYDTAKRQEEMQTFNRAKQVAQAGRQLRIVQQRATELSKQPNGPTGSFPFSGSTYPAEQPSVVARQMMDRVAPIAMRVKPLLDPKAKLVVEDPTTGDYLPHPSIVKPWMEANRNARAGQGANAVQLRVLDPETAKVLLQKTGGDKNAARQLASQMGFQIPQLQ